MDDVTEDELSAEEREELALFIQNCLYTSLSKNYEISIEDFRIATDNLLDALSNEHHKH